MPAARLPLPAAAAYVALRALATIWLPAALLVGWAVAWSAKWMTILGVAEVAAAGEAAALAWRVRQPGRVTARLHGPR